MKNLLLTLAALALLSYLAFHFANRNDINLEVSENESELNISAEFPDEKTPVVKNYLKKELKLSKNISTKNNKIEENISLEDGTFFYMKLAEGRLKIEMERKRNSQTAYKRLKKMFEGLKTVLTTN
ncbi:hypothetical protein [Lacihabitans sp. CS3-21]|uniref:hypothetical protein n=1 Tax=Lacihabitans sp. CS3-21 TaxID=2487332 RepID=UPI0020CDDC8A|nr:hypothetical protein [Lacihabitans sp. CS3-21]MCP9746777.1 hypothetical protein [Lacihabitans sp. CS3-21]